MIGIYWIKNKLNGKYYIGSSTKIAYRLYGHKQLLKTNKHQNRHLQSAWHKYGENAFIFEVIELLAKSTTRAYLLEIEQWYLDNTRCTDRLYGYNISANPVSKAHSEETKTRIAIAHKGKKAAEATKAKVSANHRNYNTPEMVAKMCATVALRYVGGIRGQLDKARLLQHKPVAKLDLNGNVLERYDTVREAEKVSGVSRRYICKCCKGLQTKHKGVTWKYQIDLTT